MLTINTRYVSNVSIGFRVRPVAPHVRYKPYRPPKERHRTRSENNDNDAMTFVQDIVEDCVESTLEIKQLKKSKSLESIIAENSEDGDTKAFKLGIEKLSEVEFVSNSIQNLKVVE